MSPKKKEECVPVARPTIKEFPWTNWRTGSRCSGWHPWSPQWSAIRTSVRATVQPTVDPAIQAAQTSVHVTEPCVPLNAAPSARSTVVLWTSSEKVSHGFREDSVIEERRLAGNLPGRTGAQTRDAAAPLHRRRLLQPECVHRRLCGRGVVCRRVLCL